MTLLNFLFISSLSLISRKDFIQSLVLTPIVFNDIYQKPVVVIGGSGYLGSDCVKSLINLKKDVRIVSRNPQILNDFEGLKIDYQSADVLDKSSLSSVIKDSSAVIFVPNNKKGVINDFQKDNSNIFNEGLRNVAETCLEFQIPRLVFPSTSKKTCLYKDKTDICLLKSQGEDYIRYLYSNPDINKGFKSSYTICRTGLITIGEKRGVKEIEINQDFTKNGILSRADLADILVNSLDNPNTFDKTFESYYRDTIQPVDIQKSLKICNDKGRSNEECFFGSSFKNRKPKNLDEVLKTPIKDTLFYTGNEFSGNSWSELFSHLKDDKEIFMNIKDLFQEEFKLI